MKLNFYKYQGAGNDFILIDNRNKQISEASVKLISSLCDRRFGIGADGLMLLEKHQDYDFEMKYYNADGAEGSMCGNGGRCIVAFAKFLGLIENKTSFLAVDGPHEALIVRSDYVELKMGAVSALENIGSDCFLDTGSPHYVRFVDNVDQLDVYTEGRAVRYNERFAKEGTNVNFVETSGPKSLKVATYERGVEDETLACGTGVTAAALAHFWEETKQAEGLHEYNIKVKGGDLGIKFKAENKKVSDVWLLGPAVQVFEGVIEI
jgi:diaminopimelate epimerase